MIARSAACVLYLTAVAACAEAHKPARPPSRPEVACVEPAAATPTAADTPCGPAVVMPQVPQTNCRFKASGLDVELEYGPGLTVGIDWLSDWYSFSGKDVFVTGAIRGRLRSPPPCINRRMATTKESDMTIEVTELGSEQVRVVGAPWTHDCRRDSVWAMQITPCQETGLGSTTPVTRLRRFVDIPVSREPGGPPHDILRITRPEHAFARVGMSRGHPFVVWRAAAPYEVAGFVPESAIAGSAPPNAASLLFGDRDHYFDIGPFRRGRHAIPPSLASRRILTCAYPPVARVGGTYYGFGTPGAGEFPPSWRGAPVYEYEVLGPAEGDWLPVKMARAWVEVRDQFSTPSVRLELDDSVPHFYPVAHLRQCLYEDWDRGEWPARLPDGTAVGVYAPPISCACQKRAFDASAPCYRVLAAPAQL